MVEIVGKQIGPVGFGLMGTYCIVKRLSYQSELKSVLGLTWRPVPPSEEQAFQAMHEAVASGCNFVSGRLKQIIIKFNIFLESKTDAIEESIIEGPMLCRA